MAGQVKMVNKGKVSKGPESLTVNVLVGSSIYSGINTTCVVTSTAGQALSMLLSQAASQLVKSGNSSRLSLNSPVNPPVNINVKVFNHT